MNGKHLLICGERGIGKSTLIRRLLAASPLPVGGFVTKRDRVPIASGFFPVYLHPAEQAEDAWRRSAENLVGLCDSHIAERHGEVFDTLGVHLIERTQGGILLMDELGFLESDAAAFQRAVLTALSGDVPVLAAVKAKDTPFLRTLRAHPNAQLVEITRENRDALYHQLLPLVLAWNG